MDKQLTIHQTAEHVRKKLTGEGSGHDWWHVYRVWKNALSIGRHEDVDIFVVELAALLHDIADWKFHDGDKEAGPREARKWLEGLTVDEDVVSHVCRIIHDVSFQGAGVTAEMETEEGKVVQDADRLDAIGAIGVARAFAYGGSKGREMHDPEIEPEMHASFEQYKNSRGTTINHFHEKLLLLKSLMNTESARKLAEHRHHVTEDFLGEFLKEWEGET